MHVHGSLALGFSDKCVHTVGQRFWKLHNYTETQYSGSYMYTTLNVLEDLVVQIDSFLLLPAVPNHKLYLLVSC